MKVFREIITQGLLLLGALCNVFYLLIVAMLPLSAGCGGAPDTWVWWAIYIPAPFVLVAQPRIFRYLEKLNVAEK